MKTQPMCIEATTLPVIAEVLARKKHVVWQGPVLPSRILPRPSHVPCAIKSLSRLPGRIKFVFETSGCMRMVFGDLRIHSLLRCFVIVGTLWLVVVVVVCPAF